MWSELPPNMVPPSKKFVRVWFRVAIIFIIGFATTFAWTQLWSGDGLEKVASARPASSKRAPASPASSAKPVAMSVCQTNTIRVEKIGREPRSDCGQKATDVCCEHHDDGAVYFSCGSSLTDPHNCGSCGRTCLDSEACVDGRCGCGEGESRCGKSCSSLQNDAENCGSCGHKCKQFCEQGKCGTCERGLTWCEGDPANFKNAGCANLKEDNWSCGKCNHQCPDGYSCVSGHCQR
jgi:hypothetical protein